MVPDGSANGPNSAQLTRTNFPAQDTRSPAVLVLRQELVATALALAGPILPSPARLPWLPMTVFEAVPPARPGPAASAPRVLSTWLAGEAVEGYLTVDVVP